MLKYEEKNIYLLLEPLHDLNHCLTIYFKEDLACWEIVYILYELNLP